MSKSVFLVLTSAIGLAGEIARAGDVVEVTPAEATNLLRRGKGRLATADDGVEVEAEGLRTDGPTIAEFVAAGYPAANYPPAGYEPNSTAEEIAAAVAAEAPTKTKPADKSAGDDKANT